MRFIEFLKSFGGGLGISGRVNVNPSRMAGRLIALDEVLINGLLGLCSVDVDGVKYCL